MALLPVLLATVIAASAPAASPITITPLTGPDTTACANAIVKVTAAAQDAVNAAHTLATAQASLTSAKTAVDLAQTELDQAIATAKADPTDAGLQQAVSTATTKLGVKLQLMLSAAIPGTLTETVDDTSARLQAALNVQVAECAAPGTTTTTATAAPTTTATAAPTSTTTAAATTTPSSGTGTITQVKVVPVGPADTGDGSTPIAA